MRIQKNYRDFTVGELLDLGLDVEIKKHRVTEEEGKRITSMFEGTRQTTYWVGEKSKIKSFKVVRGWKGEFEVKCFTERVESQ